MLRNFTGTVATMAGGTLQSGFIRMTPVGATPGALAPVPKLYIISDGVIAASTIDGGVEYLVEVFDPNLKAVYPDFHATVTDIADPITWAEIYASANTHVPPATSLTDVINARVAAIGPVTLVGTWNAATNSPALASGVGTKGSAYVVATAGTTALNGINTWAAGDWAVFDGTVWRKVNNADSAGGGGDMTKAVYDPNNDGKVSTAALADEAKAAQAGSALRTEIDGKAATAHTHEIADVTDLTNQLGAKIPFSQKGAANGVAELDATGKVPTAQLPAAVIGGVSYQGTWDAAANTPALTSSSGTKGHYYRVATAGATALDGITDWKVGDWAIFDGTVWQKVDNTDQVTSVAGRQGDVTLEIADTTGLQTTLDAKVVKAGDTMTGALTLSGAPTANLHAATKEYVDDNAGIPLSNPTVNSLVGRRTDGTYYYKSDPDGVVYNIDAVKAANPGFTDGDAIQWILNRVTLDDAGAALAVPRSIVIEGTRLYDITAHAYQETTTPNGGVTSGANAQMLIPGVGPITSKPFVTVTFRGPVVPVKSYSVIDAGNTNVMSVDGFIIKSTKAASGTDPCMIGVSQAVNGYGTGTTYFSLVHLIMENVTIRTSNGAPITAVDTRHAIMRTFTNVSIDTGTTSNNISDPSASTAGFGVRNPKDFNGAWIEDTNVFIQGYKVGMEVTEHTHIISAYINYCAEGLRFVAASHASYIERILLQWNDKHIVFSGGAHNTTIKQLDFEGYNTGLGVQWYKTALVIDDPSNYGVGSIQIVCGSWFSDAQLSYLTSGVVNGGAYLSVMRHQPLKRLHNTGDAVAGNAFLATSDGFGATVYYQQPSANGDISRHSFWLTRGVYRLTIWAMTNNSSGIIDVKVIDENGNRTIAAGVDLYTAGADWYKMLSYDIPIRVTGRNYIRFDVTGKNASSTAHDVRIGFVEITPLWGLSQ